MGDAKVGAESVAAGRRRRVIPVHLSGMHAFTRGSSLRCSAAAALLLTAACTGALPGVRGRTVEEPPPVFTTSDTTALFAPGVISTGDAFGASFTPDGRTVFFTRAAPDRARMQIMRSEWRGLSWSTPRRADFSTGPRDSYPHVSGDGKTLYFTAPRRRTALATDLDGDWDTWRVALDGISEPAREASLANSNADETVPSITFTAMLVFAAAPRGDTAASGEIRYMSPQLRSTPAIISLGRDVDHPITPYVNRAGRVLIIAARGADNRGRTDLYVLVRRGDGRWSAPRNLGREVNGTDAEFAPQLSPDERHLFFSRTRFAQGRSAGTDILVVPVRSVPVLRDALAEPL
jgi:hypothetical protein